MPLADIGLIGLAVMGQNLVLNLHDHGFRVAVFNRTTAKVDSFIGAHPEAKQLVPCHSLQEFTRSLSSPKRILLMVQAGDGVDATINGLLPYLTAGDVIIDGGNSNFHDTRRRYDYLQMLNIGFIGAGISGGEDGARHGPSIMPGGNQQDWPLVKPFLQAIAAKTDQQPCCEWVGPDGAGHFVKMVHNGIEYGDMQLIAEAYHLLYAALGLSAPELASTFSNWNKGVLDSYLIQITADIFTKMDNDGLPLVDKIVDQAQQKGTGKWTGINALELGTPLTLIAEAVFARAISAKKSARIHANRIYQPVMQAYADDKTAMINAIHDALYTAKIISYTQGFMLLQDAAKEYQWPLDYAAIARLWRGGCIIRSRFLGDISRAYQRDPALENLLFDEFFIAAIQQHSAGLRTAVKTGIDCGIALPTLSSALAFLDSFTCARSPANLTQAQRDYFGAHTYQRIDNTHGDTFHTEWNKK